MAKFTVKEALELTDLSDGAVSYLERLSKSGIDKIKNKVFNATTKAALKKEIEELVVEKEETKEPSLDDCLKVIRSMVKGTKSERRLISPSDLLPKLEALKAEVEKEKKGEKLFKFMEKTGMTETQIMELVALKK